jgi:hypothetical protein
LLRRTLAARFGETKTGCMFSETPQIASKAAMSKIFQVAGNKRVPGTVLEVAASVAFKTGFKGMIDP